MKLIAKNNQWKRTTAAFGLITALLGGCALPEKPQRATLYDFGPGLVATAPSTRLAPLPPISLAEVDASPAFDGNAVLYRLAYTDANQLRPYAQARWSMPPAQLVHQRLRAALSQRRAVLGADEASALATPDGARPRILRVDVEEFSHLFDAPEKSNGLVRLRATLLEATPAGEKLLAQRSVIVQRPAASGDAPGGVRALADATDAAVQELQQWLDTVPVAAGAGVPGNPLTAAPARQP